MNFYKYAPYTMGILSIPVINAWITIPLFIDVWGNDLYAQWILLISTVSICSIFFGAISKTYQFELANNRDDQAILRITFVNFLTNYFIIFFIASAFIIIFILYREKVGAPLNILLILNIFLNQIVYVISIFFLSCLRIKSKYLQYFQITLLYAFLNLILIIFLLQLGFAPLRLTKAILIANVIFCICCYILVFNFFPKLNFNLISYEFIKSAIIKSLSRVIVSNNNNIKLYIEIIIISILFTPAILIVYATTMMLVNCLSLFHIKFNEGFEELFSAIIVKQKKIKHKYYKFIMLQLGLLLFFSVILFYISENIYVFWLQGKVIFDKQLFTLALVYLFSNSVVKSLTFLHDISNQLEFFALHILTVSFLSLIVSYNLIPYLGIYSFSYSGIIGNIILILIILSKYKFYDTRIKKI
jgi:O-antigen/teichoic acid export membrane protein